MSSTSSDCVIFVLLQTVGLLPALAQCQTHLNVSSRAMVPAGYAIVSADHCSVAIEHIVTKNDDQVDFRLFVQVCD